LVKFSKKLETQWMKVSELSGRRLTLHSDCVTQIFSILEMRFGTPEIIIDLLLKQRQRSIGQEEQMNLLQGWAEINF